jgi:N-acetylmuramic acid 6-phosphate etherase
MGGLDELITEIGEAGVRDLDLRSTRDLVGLMNTEDAGVPAAVGSAADSIAAVVDEIVERLHAGGRLVYAGAGTSGEIAALDAAECEATFGTPVLAISAGMDTALEDDAGAGARAVEQLTVGPNDALVAVSASGRSPFAVGAAEAAAAAGAFSACLVAVRDSALAAIVEREIVVETGPELIAGSTRLKAGTAQKLVLNTISTVAMIRLGKTYGNLMIDVAAGNEKLRARVRRIVREVTGASDEAADDALQAAGGDPRVAIVSLSLGIDTAAARARLAAVGGNLRHALLP